MTERRRRRRRQESTLVVGVSIGFGLALLSVVAADLTGHRMPGGVRQAVLSIDPLAGSAAPPPPDPAPVAASSRITRAGLGLGGEIILDGPEPAAPGELRLDDRPAAPAGGVLEEVSPGDHEVSLVREGRVVWRRPVRVEEAGTARILLPATADTGVAANPEFP
jgi:hypothetical protein